ncbi:MAG: hypothetical protein ACPGJE_09435 [Wenzhouxiangellaceae bacterium]
MRFAAAPLALIAILGATGCVPEPVPPGPTEPECAPRAVSDPGRLNINSRAENHGMLPPCQTTLTFSIAANTALRGLDGAIRVTDADGKMIREAPLSVSLTGPEGGMFRGMHEVSPVPEQICRGTSLELVIQRCRGADGAEIACPEVRVRASQVLLRLEASGAGVSVCYDE